MNDRDAFVQVLDQLAAEVQALKMAQAVQHSAYILLVRHLAAQGLAQPVGLAKDLQTIACTQPDADWQSGHVYLAGALRCLRATPSRDLKSAGHPGH